MKVHKYLEGFQKACSYYLVVILCLMKQGLNIFFKIFYRFYLFVKNLAGILQS